MNTKALVVEDDPGAVEVIEDSLYSLDHEYIWANNLQDARSALESQDIGYVLLDLEFPTKPIRGFARASKENGSLLLEDIQRVKGAGQLPVIIMSGHVAYCLNRSIEFRDKGATEFIAKPFPTEGRTLTRLIRGVLKRQAKRAASTSAASTGRFTGGELVYFDDHVELLGVKIISDRGAGLTIGLLRELRSRFNGDRYVPISAEELAGILGVPDVNTITGCIRGLRRNIVNRLRKYLNIEIGPKDVICRDEQGYYLRPWIVVRNGDDVGDVAASVPDVSGVRADAPVSELNERQQWALRQLDIGVKLQRVMLEHKFNVAEKTAKRDLAEMSRRGKVEYVRVGRDGYYRLNRSENSDHES